MTNQKYAKLQELSRAVEDLRKAILSAIAVLEAKPNPSENAFERLDKYLELNATQRKYTYDLAGYIAEGNVVETQMAVKRINGLSELIRNDASELLGELSDQPRKPVWPDLPN